jgi:hypothetical protein
MDNRKIYCKLCNFIGKVRGPGHLFKHVRDYHGISLKDYYDRFYKTETDGICIKCGNPTRFSKYSHVFGYEKFCSKKCQCSFNSKRSWLENRDYIMKCLNHSYHSKKRWLENEDYRNKMTVILRNNIQQYINSLSFNEEKR